MRPSLVTASIVACAALFGAVASAAEAPSAEAIFAHAKDAWRTRQEVPFIAYNMRERYEWRGRTHDNWWQVAYRDRDRALALRRTIVAADEAKRLRINRYFAHRVVMFIFTIKHHYPVCIHHYYV